MIDRVRPLVGILLYDDVEVLDFAGPYEVLSATLDDARLPYCRVITLGARPEVCARGGLRIRVDHVLQDAPALDALIVPGGPGAGNSTEDQARHLLPFLRARAVTTPLVASVCTGAFLLGRAGILAGRRATTHTAALADFRREFPDVDAVLEKVVDEGPVLTAMGVSSGIDLALHLLGRWFGEEARARGARDLDGPWV